MLSSCCVGPQGIEKDDAVLISEDRRESKAENVDSSSDDRDEDDEATEWIDSEGGRLGCGVEWRANWASSTPGLCKQRSGNLSALVAAGAVAPAIPFPPGLQSPTPGSAAMAGF